ncbi:hypothetical protein [Brachybacterium sp. GPGPB12]|uniref:hypothetical protein n=1 Tax=Brachybacterium sp. GPGPB12 TaxID=3023517 RepID=UPI00313450F5
MNVVVPVLTLMGLSDTPALYDGIHPLPGQMARDLAAAEPVWHRVLADPADGGFLPRPPSATAPPPTRWSICGSCTRARRPLSHAHHHRRRRERPHRGVRPRRSRPRRTDQPPQPPPPRLEAPRSQDRRAHRSTAGARRSHHLDGRLPGPDHHPGRTTW